MKIYKILGILAFSAYLPLTQAEAIIPKHFKDLPAEEVEQLIKIGQQKCQYMSMIASTTQQTRQDYLKEVGYNQAWETFLTYVLTNMPLKHDEGLKGALEISKKVFFEHLTEEPVDSIMVKEFDKCWANFLEEHKDDTYI